MLKKHFRVSINVHDCLIVDNHTLRSRQKLSDKVIWRFPKWTWNSIALYFVWNSSSKCTTFILLLLESLIALEIALKIIVGKSSIIFLKKFQKIILFSLSIFEMHSWQDKYIPQWFFTRLDTLNIILCISFHMEFEISYTEVIFFIIFRKK